MTTYGICADCGATFPSKGPSKRCKPCRSDHYDEMQAEKQKAAKLARKRAEGG